MLDPWFMALHLGDLNFIQLLLKCPESNPKLLFSLCILQNEELKRKLVQKRPSPYPVTKMLSLILDNADHAKINVNDTNEKQGITVFNVKEKCEKQGLTVMHMLACGAPAAFGKFMVENAKKYGIDLYAKDQDGATPFEGVLQSSYDIKNTAKRLDYWFKHNPELLKYDVFKQMKESKLQHVLVFLYNKKVEMGECTKEVDKDLYMKNPHKYLTNQFIKKKGIKRHVIESVVWQLYQDKFNPVEKDPEEEPQSKSKRQKFCFLM